MELKIITNLNIESLFPLQAAGEAKETEKQIMEEYKARIINVSEGCI